MGGKPWPSHGHGHGHGPPKAWVCPASVSTIGDSVREAADLPSKTPDPSCAVGRGDEISFCEVIFVPIKQGHPAEIRVLAGLGKGHFSSRVSRSPSESQCQEVGTTLPKSQAEISETDPWRPLTLTSHGSISFGKRKIQTPCRQILCNVAG